MELSNRLHQCQWYSAGSSICKQLFHGIAPSYPFAKKTLSFSNYVNILVVGLGLIENQNEKC